MNRQGRSLRPASISDVANMAKVSVATVSRVLNDPAAVSAKRREAVEDAMKRLGYRPSAAARALVTGHNQTVAILVSNTAKYGYSSAIQGIEEAARHNNVIVTITVIDSDRLEDIDATLDLVLSQSVSGIVGLEFDTIVAAAIRRIPENIPLAVAGVAGTADSGRPRIYIDDALGTLKATSYLLSLGHETVHYVAVANPAFPETGRISGWRNALIAANRRVPALIETTWEPEDALRLATTSIGEDVTALMCHNDEIAMGVISGLEDAGRSIPADISVIGIDNHPLSKIWRPQLTTVEIDFRDVGWRTFQLLAESLSGGSVGGTVRVEPPLVIRESTGVPRLKSTIPA